MAKFELGVNPAGRPDRLCPADQGREFRSEFLPMPPIKESRDRLEALCREAGLAEAVILEAEGIMVQAFARGATVGFTRGLAKRNELLGRLVYEGPISLRELRDVAQLSDSQLRKILREEGMPAARPERSGPPRLVFPARRRK